MSRVKRALPEDTDVSEGVDVIFADGKLMTLDEFYKNYDPAEVYGFDWDDHYDVMGADEFKPVQ